jgi:hypothetical protein
MIYGTETDFDYQPAMQYEPPAHARIYDEPPRDDAPLLVSLVVWVAAPLLWLASLVAIALWFIGAM